MPTQAKNNSQNRGTAQSRWTLIVVLSFIVILLLVLISFVKPQWFQESPTLFRFLLAFFGGVLVASFLGGYINIQSGAIKASGGLAIFIILYFTDPLESKQSFFNTTLNLHGSKGISDKVIRKGEVSYSVENATLSGSRPIDSNGNVSISDNPTTLKGNKVSFQLKSDEFQLLYPDSLYPLIEKINLAVTPVLIDRVFGTITTETGDLLAGTTIKIGRIVGMTDEHGRFDIAIPASRQTSTATLVVEKAGYITFDNKEKYQDEIDVTEAKSAQLIQLKKVPLKPKPEPESTEPIPSTPVSPTPLPDVESVSAPTLPIQLINSPLFFFPPDKTVSNLKTFLCYNIIPQELGRMNRCAVVRFGELLTDEQKTLVQAGFTPQLNQINLACNGMSMIYNMRTKQINITGIILKVSAAFLNGNVVYFNQDHATIRINAGIGAWEVDQKNTIELYGENNKIVLRNLQENTPLEKIIIDGENGQITGHGN